MKTFVMKMCGRDECPRIVINCNRIVLRDDYNKKGFSAGKKLVNLIARM